MITKDIAVSLRHGTTLYHTTKKNADGSSLRCRVSGKCQTWVTQPDDFRLPVKHGLRNSFSITPSRAEEWGTEPPAPTGFQKLPLLLPAEREFWEPDTKLRHVEAKINGKWYITVEVVKEKKPSTKEQP